MTLKSKPDGGKLRRFQSVGTRASYVVANIDATSSFGTKMRIEKVRGNRKGITVSCLRHLCFSEEKKMRFIEGEVVLYRLKIRSMTTNVAEVDRKKNVRGMSRHLGAISEGQSDLGTFMVPSPEGNSEAGVAVTIFN